MYPVLPSAHSTATTRTRAPTTGGRTQASNTTAARDHLESPTNNKRSPSMIFRIEHLLPHAEATAEQHQGSSSTHAHAQTAARGGGDYQGAAGAAPKRIKLAAAARSGVYVAQFTAKDTRSETFSTLSVMSTAATTTVAASAGVAEPTSYCHLSNGVLCMTPAILRKIKLSEDIHSYNALFEIHNGNVRVRVIRDIGRDDELVAWFGEEATLLMSIPFLTPLNIQGNSRYTCHLCHLTFETPNPLKIHLALACGRHSMDILWIRLHYALKATTFGQHQLLPPALPLPLAPSASNTSLTGAHHSPIGRDTISPSMSSSSSSTTSCISPSSSPQPSGPQQQQLPQQHSQSAQRLSAFKPIASAPSVVVCTRPTLTMPLPPPHLTTVASTSGVSTSVFTMHHAMHSHHHPLHPMLGGGGGALPHPSMGGGLLMPTGGEGGGHIANPLNAAAQIEAIVSNMGASKQGHLCIYCGKVYSRKYGLKIHIRTHTGFKPLKCKFCLRPFGDPSNLNKHVRLHLQAGGSSGSAGGPQDGYKCHLCHKTLARRRDLQRHMESRHGQSDDNNASRK